MRERADRGEEEGAGWRGAVQSLAWTDACTPPDGRLLAQCDTASQAPRAFVKLASGHTQSLHLSAQQGS